MVKRIIRLIDKYILGISYEWQDMWYPEYAEWFENGESTPEAFEKMVQSIRDRKNN